MKQFLSICGLLIYCSLNDAINSSNYTAVKGTMMNPYDTDLKLQYKVPKTVISIHIITQALTQTLISQKSVEQNQ